MIIAIDGPAASGMGTLGKRLAAHYGLRHLDTGLIYRAVAAALLDAGQRLEDRESAVDAARVLDSFERWRRQIDGMKHTELAELILDESGYTQMWQQDKSSQAQARLENLKELIRFMHEFDTLQGFLEHVSLVMDADTDSIRVLNFAAWDARRRRLAELGGPILPPDQ